MNSVRRQELGNELQSSQHLRLQSASRKLLNIATVPARSGKVQRKKPIASIERATPFASSELSGLELSSRAIVGSRGARAKIVEGPGFCRRNVASRCRTNPGPSLVLTAQARLGAVLGMTVQRGAANQRSG